MFNYNRGSTTRAMKSIKSIILFLLVVAALPLAFCLKYYHEIKIKSANSLRRQPQRRTLHLASPKHTKLYHDDNASNQDMIIYKKRMLTTTAETADKSRVGAFPAPDEKQDETIVDFQTFTSHHQVVSTSPPTIEATIITNYEVEGEEEEEDNILAAMNTHTPTKNYDFTTAPSDESTSGNMSVYSSNELVLTPSTSEAFLDTSAPSPVLTVPPSLTTVTVLKAPPKNATAATATTTTTTTVSTPSMSPSLSASARAQLVGNSIVKGVNDNLAEGRKGGGKGKMAKTGTAAKTTGTTTPYYSQDSTGTGTAGSKKTAAGSKKQSIKGATSKTSQNGVYGTSTPEATATGNAKGVKGANKSTKKGSAEKSTQLGTSESVSLAGTSKSGKGGGKYESDGNAKSGILGTSGGGGKGKRGKGSKNSAFGSGTYVSEASAAPAPTTYVANAVLAPGETPEYPAANGENASVMTDCTAIAEGTASTDSPHQESFTVTSHWIVSNEANFDEIASGVQNYLQTSIAPAIAGCKPNRKKRLLQFIPAQSLITNVVFGLPTNDGSCTTNQANADCYVTKQGVQIYFYGVDAGVGSQLLSYLQAAGVYPVYGLLGVVNLSVFDSEGNQIGRYSDGADIAGIGNGNEYNSVGGTGPPSGTGNEDSNSGEVNSITSSANADQSLSSWSRTLIGVSVATALLGVVLSVLVFRRCRQHGEGDKVDFQNLPPEQAVTRVVGKGASTGTSNAVLFLDDQSAFSRTWEVHGDDSSEDEADTVEVMMHNGETHICNSAYCEVCGRNGNQIQFVASNMDQPEQLPADASRNYYVNDTVAL